MSIPNDRLYLHPFPMQRACGKKGFFVQKETYKKDAYCLGHTDEDPLNRFPGSETTKITISKRLFLALQAEVKKNTKQFVVKETR